MSRSTTATRLISALTVSCLVSAALDAAYAGPRNGQLQESTFEELVTDDGIVSDLAVFEKNTGGQVVSFIMTPFGEPSESWRFEVRKNGSDRQTSSLHIDGRLAYRVSVTTGDAGQPVRMSLATQRVANTISEGDDRAAIRAETAFALNDIAYYRGVVYEVLLNVVSRDGGLIGGVAAATCGSSCEAEYPKPADCDGWWDEYQCCLAEADKDACRRWCECTGGACEIAVAAISVIEHELCAAGLLA